MIRPALARPAALAGVTIFVIAGCSSATTAQAKTRQPTVAPAATSVSAFPSSTAASSSTPAPTTGGAAFGQPDVVAAALAAARTNVARTSTYDYRHLAQDLVSGEAVSTGAYAQQFRTAFTTTIEPQAPRAKAVQTAKVSRVGISSLDPAGQQAVVLAVGELTQHRAGVAPQQTPFAVTVTVALVGGRWLIAKLASAGPTTGASPGTPDLGAAYTAGQAAATAVLTFSRARFDADFARALAGTTATLRTDLLSRKATTLAALRKGGFDLSAEVVSAAVASAATDTVEVLVVANGFRVTSSGARTAPNVQRLVLTMRKTGGRWLAADLTTIGLS